MAINRMRRRTLAVGIAVLVAAVFASACDHTSRALVHGQVKKPGGVPMGANIVVLIAFDQTYRYATVTSSEGKYVCPLTEFVGPLGDRKVVVRAMDGTAIATVDWEKGGAVKATRADVFVRDSTVDLRASTGDSIPRFYRPCS